MNKLKRTAALLMAAGLSLSMLAGCGTSGQDSTSASPDAEQNTSEGAAEGYTYKIATVRWNDTWPTDFLTDGVMGDLAEEADIDIEWQIYYSNDFGEQKALLFASDDLPDAFFGSCGLGDSDIVQNKEKLLELTDLINEETMPNLMKIFEEDPTMRMACTDRNGQIYSLPKKIPFRPKLSTQNYINKEWLDNLNLEMPTNYDELKEVLIAFKEQDADGDGDPNNEIPLSCYKPGYGSAFALLDSFDLIERGDEHMSLDENDKVVFVPAHEHYKEAVKYYRELWELGVMDEEFFTQDQAMYTAKLQKEGGSQVGIFSGWTADSWAGPNTKQFVQMPTLESPWGTKNAQSIASTEYSDKEMILNINCPDPEKVLRWADLFYDDLVSLQTFYGSISTGQIKDNGDGTYELLTPEDNTLDTSAWMASPRDFGPKYMRKEFEEKVTLPTDQGDGLKLAEDALNAQYADNPDLLHAWPGTIKFTDDEINERTALNVDINSYVEAQWAHWITEGGVEEEWDDYLQQLDAMGLQRLIEIDQGAYDAYVEMMG